MTIGEVTPHLFLGPAPLDDGDFQQLENLKITAIFSVENPQEGTGDAIDSERKAAIRSGMRFENLPVTDFDRPELARKLPECVQTLEALLVRGETLYLHCTAGVNRSPTVAVAYLYWVQKWPLAKALAHVRGCRNCVPDREAIRMASWTRSIP